MNGLNQNLEGGEAKFKPGGQADTVVAAALLEGCGGNVLPIGMRLMPDTSPRGD